VIKNSLELNKKYGEYSHAILLKPDSIHKTIEVGKAFSNKQYANNQDKITVAKLVGAGIQDLAASTVLMKKL
jgi:ornithine cyclodeaminase/alanine dehydrogenase-like protein (mu-crystallin family)